MEANITNASVETESIADHWQYTGSIAIFRYGSPTLILVGTLCNVLALVVLQTKSYRGTSMGFLLSILAAADILALNTGLMRRWIMALPSGKDIRAFNTGACLTHMILTLLSRHVSAWTLTLVTLDRVIFVYMPLRSRTLFCFRRVVISWLVVFAILLAVNSHVFFNYEIGSVGFLKGKCAPKRHVLRMELLVWPWVDMALVFAAPFLLILTGNICILVKILKASRRRQTTLRAREQGSKTSSSTIMLVMVSVAFLLTTLPSGIYFIGYSTSTWPKVTPEEKARIKFANAVTQMLFFTNNAVNFFMYCAWGAKFRAALRSLVGNKGAKLGQKANMRAKSGSLVTTNTQL